MVFSLPKTKKHFVLLLNKDHKNLNKLINLPILM